MRVRVARNDIPRIKAQLRVRAGAAVAETALEIESAAKARSRVETGTMRRGWNTRFEDAVHATISNPVPYATYHEFGTHKMSAQPMIVPAVEAARPRFFDRLRKIFG